MEEVYVIRLRGIQSTSTSDSSSSAVDTNDIVRGSVLGLGVLHVTFGILILVFGALRSASERSEPAETVFGTLFGPLFVATGICAILSWKRPFRKLKLKVFFGMSMLSLLSSATFLCLCMLGVVYFHSVPRMFGDAAHVTANAMLAAVGETVVALLSVLTAGSAVWKRFQCGAFKPSTGHHQKVIVKTNIFGGKSTEGALDDGMIKHVSPHCVISLRAADEQQEVIKKVREYLHSQDELSFTFSDPSSLQEEQNVENNWTDDLHAQDLTADCVDKQIENEQGTDIKSCYENNVDMGINCKNWKDEEQDLGVDSQNWQNEVLSVNSGSIEENSGLPIENSIIHKR